jgi:hypothetical protein
MRALMEVILSVYFVTNQNSLLFLAFFYAYFYALTGC